MHEGCKGCLTYELSICFLNFSTVRRRSIKRICPCVNCLIKVMCSSECEQYIDYREFIGEDINMNYNMNKEGCIIPY